jgi:hypothetical protein
VPVAKRGQPMALQFAGDDGAANAEVTATGVEVHPRTSVDKAGTKEFCFGFKLKDTGASRFDGGFDWKWFGLDGEEVDDLDAGTAGMCDAELGHQFAGLDQPAPLPGKFVSGYYSFLIPTKPGAVEITDGEGTPLFRLDYGPQSAQVPIDARGQ